MERVLRTARWSSSEGLTDRFATRAQTPWILGQRPHVSDNVYPPPRKKLRNPLFGLDPKHAGKPGLSTSTSWQPAAFGHAGPQQWLPGLPKQFHNPPAHQTRPNTPRCRSSSTDSRLEHKHAGDQHKSHRQAHLHDSGSQGFQVLQSPLHAGSHGSRDPPAPL